MSPASISVDIRPGRAYDLGAVATESETVTVSESEGARIDGRGPLSEGATLGRYVVVKHIASGGAGSVYAALGSKP